APDLVYRVTGPRFPALVQAGAPRRLAAAALDRARPDSIAERPGARHGAVPLGRAQPEERGRVLHDRPAALPASHARDRAGMSRLALLFAILAAPATFAAVTYSFDWYCSGCSKLGMGSNGR